jgi:hypothetical protein
VSCASAGNCAAVGVYTDKSGNAQGLLLDESSGKWAQGVEAPLPANAASSEPAGRFVSLDQVSCASAGNCTAVGYYPDSSGNLVGLLLDESSGAWAQGVEAPLPANALSPQNSFVFSVSCPSAGNCTAVGSYADSSELGQGLLLEESSGKWRGVEATPPANADPGSGSVYPDSVSCPSVGNCAAVGTYGVSFGGEQGLLLDERSGTWAQGMEAVLPANAGSFPEVFISSVSCPSTGNCTAVGSYDDNLGHSQGLLLSESTP